MRVELGEHIQTSDGKDVGTVGRYIFDPETSDVRAVVIRHRAILPREVEVPVDLLQPGPRGTGVRLAYTAVQASQLLEFHQTSHAAAPPSTSPHSADIWPPRSTVSPAEPALTPPLSRLSGTIAVSREQVLEKAVVGAGSDVMTRDGEKVGEVARLAIDATSGRPLGLVVRKGFLFHQDVELPVETIARVHDGILYLDLDKSQVKGYGHH